MNKVNGYIFPKQVAIDHRDVGNSVEAKLYSNYEDKEEKPILVFTMNEGEKFLIFEDASGVIFAEEKKHFYKWRTISNLRVSPHKHMKKFHSCDFCPYEKR